MPQDSESNKSNGQQAKHHIVINILREREKKLEMQLVAVMQL